MTEQEKLGLALYALRVIALSYRERIDRQDTSPYEFAEAMVRFLGGDLETIPPDNDLVNDLAAKFRAWCKENEER
jgi:hypothetical protein